MFASRTTQSGLFVFLLAGAMQSPAALAGHGRSPGRQFRADVDIESLKAEICFDRGAWSLSVCYEVEIEDLRGSPRFDLVLGLIEGGRPVLDRFGRPMVFVIPLSRPTEIDRCGEEVKFKDRFAARLPNGACVNPERLKVEARVVAATNGCVMDTDDCSVRFQRGGLRIAGAGFMDFRFHGRR